MAVHVVFRCEHCDALPDPATQRALEGQLRDRRLREYLDAQPGGWLVWAAGGPLGSKRYACREHRSELIDSVRRQHGARCTGAGKGEPYPSVWPDGFSALDEHELSALLGGASPERSGASGRRNTPAG